jgi:hypothetical protein
MKIKILRRDAEAYIDLIPENQAEMYQLEEIKVLVDRADIVNSEDRQWRIETLRLNLQLKITAEDTRA